MWLEAAGLLHSGQKFRLWALQNRFVLEVDVEPRGWHAATSSRGPQNAFPCDWNSTAAAGLLKQFLAM